MAIKSTRDLTLWRSKVPAINILLQTLFCLNSWVKMHNFHSNDFWNSIILNVIKVKFHSISDLTIVDYIISIGYTHQPFNSTDTNLYAWIYSSLCVKHKNNINIPLTQANISHSTADGVAPRFVGASSWYTCVEPQNIPPTTDSMRCEANINRTVVREYFRQQFNGMPSNLM